MVCYFHHDGIQKKHESFHHGGDDLGYIFGKILCLQTPLLSKAKDRSGLNEWQIGGLGPVGLDFWDRD